MFGRYSTYCGSSPFSAPATLMLVAHVERQGVWLVEGGMSRLAGALRDLAAERGADFRFGCRAKRIVVERGRAAGVETASGEVISADAVIWNGDVSAFEAGLLGGEVRHATPQRGAAAEFALRHDMGHAGEDGRVSAGASQRVLSATTIAQNSTRSFSTAALRQNRPFTFARKIAANGPKTSTGRSGCLCSSMRRRTGRKIPSLPRKFNHARRRL